MSRSITHKLLGDATRSRHQQLDQHPTLRVLLSAKPMQTDYVRAMQLFHQCFYLLEPIVVNYESSGLVTGLGPCVRNLKSLDQDLLALNADRIDTLIDVDFPRLKTTAQYLGVRYVLEGSAQGGAYIAAHLQEKLPDLRVSAFSYWDLQRQTAQDWPAFLSVIAQLDDDSQHQQQAVQSAMQTFDVFLAVFDTVNHVQYD